MLVLDYTAYTNSFFHFFKINLTLSEILQNVGIRTFFKLSIFIDSGNVSILIDRSKYHGVELSKLSVEL